MIQHKTSLFILVIIILIPAMGFGQKEPLSLSAALEKALENNYGIIISRADLEVAGINNNWGTAGRYPTVGFTASDNNSYEINSSSYTNRASAGAGLNWTLFDGFRVAVTKERLENLEELSSGKLAIQVESVIEDVILGYYYVLLQKEQLKVFQFVMDLSEDRYQYELNRQALGRAVTYDVLQAQNTYLTDKADFMNQEVVVRNAIRNLNFLMGMEPSRVWEFTNPFEADTTGYVLGDLQAKMTANNQTLKNQYTNLLLQENETSLREAEFFPSVSLAAGIDYGHTWSRAGGVQTLNSATMTPYGNLRLTYDLYSAGVRRRSVEIARINEDVAQVEITQMEHALTNELFNLFDYHAVRLELLQVAEDNLAAAKLNLSISEEKYRSGVINSFNYRDVQLIYLNASIQKLMAIYNLISTHTQLTRITGGFLDPANLGMDNGQ